MDQAVFMPTASGKHDSVYNYLDNFNIEKRIGKGQFSEVFRAQCKTDPSPVALKKVKVFQ